MISDGSSTVRRPASGLRAACLIPAFALLLLGAAAHADGRAAEAKQAYTDGQAAFATGRYLDAAKLFERAYQMSQRPQLLWNVATALRKQYDIDQDLAHLRRARAVYQNFGELAAGKDREDALREIAAVDDIVKEREDRARAEEARKAEEAKKATEDRKAEEARRLEAATRPAAPLPPPSPIYKRWWLWTAVGVVVAAGVGVGLGLALGPHDAAKPKTDVAPVDVTF